MKCVWMCAFILFQAFSFALFADETQETDRMREAVKTFEQAVVAKDPPYSGVIDYVKLKKYLSTDLSNALVSDEIGSGTDPKLGGAIAEAILKQWIEKRSFGIVTTHYSALKIFAFHQKGIVNGAMLFDKENLRPTYRLKVGKPGSS